MDTVAELYHKHAPRWIKVIRWREWGGRVIKHQKFLFWVAYLPIFTCFSLVDNPQAQWIAFLKPQTEEELMQIKQNTDTNLFQRNWEMGQYLSEHPPSYDLFERRKKYPEYYGDQYNTFKKYKEFGRI